MSNCTACEHPVDIPGELRGVVTEIHTCGPAEDPGKRALDQIRVRLNDATIHDGPWAVEDSDWGCKVYVRDHGFGTMYICEDMQQQDNGRQDATFIANAPTDMSRLLAAVESVIALHKPEAIYELDEHGCVNSDDESKYVRSICGVCSDSTVTESLDDGNYDLSGNWGEVGWPCPTVAAVTAALEEAP